MSAATLQWQRLQFTPKVRCEDCAFAAGPTRDATNIAKRHAKTHPGHLVVTEQVNEGRYLLPVPEPTEAAS